MVFSFLLRLLPGGGAEVGALEVVVSSGVLGPVLLKSGLVAGQTGLSQCEGVRAGAWLVEASS